MSEKAGSIKNRKIYRQICRKYVTLSLRDIRQTTDKNFVSNLDEYSKKMALFNLEIIIDVKNTHKKYESFSTNIDRKW